VLMVARRGAVDARIATLNQLRSVCLTADDRTRQRFARLSPVSVGTRDAALKPRPGDPVRYATLLAIKVLGRRAEGLRAEIKQLDRLLRPLIAEAAPGLLEVFGVGHETAARLLVAAGDNPERLRSEAAWAISVGWPPFPRRQARPPATGSTGVATGRPTAPSTTSCSPASITTNRPRTTWPAA